MKFKILTLLLFSIIFLQESLMAQCNNKIDVTSKIEESTKSGTISVQVTGNEDYIIKLLIESAEGDTLVKEENHSGNSTTEFSNLKTGVLYTVWVEFSDSQDFICRSLRKSVALTQ